MGGQILDFPLFADGTIEFDDYPTADEVNKFVWAKDVAIRKRFTIKPETVSEFQAIITRSDFEQLKPEYKKLTSSCDAAHDRTIVTVRKTVRVPQWCGKEEPPEFPQPIFDLFQRIRSVKAEKLGKHLPTP